MEAEPLFETPAEPLVEIRRSTRRRRTVSAYREGDKTVVLMPARMSKAEERHWVSTMLARLKRRNDAAVLLTTNSRSGRNSCQLSTSTVRPGRGVFAGSTINGRVGGRARCKTDRSGFQTGCKECRSGLSTTCCFMNSRTCSSRRTARDSGGCSKRFQMSNGPRGSLTVGHWRCNGLESKTDRRRHVCGRSACTASSMSLRTLSSIDAGKSLTSNQRTSIDSSLVCGWASAGATARNCTSRW